MVGAAALSSRPDFTAAAGTAAAAIMAAAGTVVAGTVVVGMEAAGTVVVGMEAAGMEAPHTGTAAALTGMAAAAAFTAGDRRPVRRGLEPENPGSSPSTA
jgi:hypothetical protein